MRFVLDPKPGRIGIAQLRLPFAEGDAYRPAEFVVSECNAEAIGEIETWRAWPVPVLAVIGPAGSGKSHIARLWAERAGASVLNPPLGDVETLPTGPIVVEDADRVGADVTMFHLLNRVEPDAAVLLTARTPPRAWPTALPDLRSRLNALRFVTVSTPDDAVLGSVLASLLRARHILPDEDLIPYLLRRIERSVDAARRVVDHLDEAAGTLKREVNRSLAAQVLGASDRASET